MKKAKYIAVQMNSTDGPFIVERASEAQMRNSRANFCGPWNSQSQAQRACEILNAPRDTDEPVLADELLAEYLKTR